ncbi:hypothetical protein SAMN02745150_00313 [Brevinema andersonii]|uniref:Uncharacterized protein n=1 Tax=Brevinema andersonii TaxID=34097 RepID=A0A1I1DBK3_BREAD|nr:hypothetical protein SAMN02745150_00313 [Brevinema andersonii]
MIFVLELDEEISVTNESKQISKSLGCHSDSIVHIFLGNLH